MNIMLAKKMITLEEYLMKLQESADRIATERNLKKITVFHLHGGGFHCSRVGDKMGLPILEEAQAKVNEKYELKSEE
jgi:hypothetical protein